MSMYSKYLAEKTEDMIKETDQAFVSYRYLPESKTVYIVDLYVLPEFRNTDVASTLADTIVEEARAKGCTTLLGSVIPSNKNSTVSLRVLLAYGMRLESSTNDFIVFKKEI